MVSLAAILAAIALVSGGALAQFARTDDAIKYRQSVMFLIGQHFTRLGGMLKGSPAYDKGAFLKGATLVQTLAAMPWDAFLVPGSDKGSQMKDDTLKDTARFKEAAKAAESAMAGLVAASGTGDVSAIQEPFGAVGKSCKNCHTAFRK